MFTERYILLLDRGGYEQLAKVAGPILCGRVQRLTNATGSWCVGGQLEATRLLEEARRKDCKGHQRHLLPRVAPPLNTNLHSRGESSVSDAAEKMACNPDRLREARVLGNPGATSIACRRAEPREGRYPRSAVLSARRIADATHPSGGVQHSYLSAPERAERRLNSGRFKRGRATPPSEAARSCNSHDGTYLSVTFCTLLKTVRITNRGCLRQMRNHLQNHLRNHPLKRSSHAVW
jgi:hypothetical protein